MVNKVDADVLKAVDELLIEESRYPYVVQWMELVSSHSQETRDR